MPSSCAARASAAAGASAAARAARLRVPHARPAVDGGLAGHVVAPAGILLDVTDSGPSLDTLGLAQPMAIAVHVVSRSGLRAGQDAVVVGVGGIGSFITFAAAASGARVVAVDRSPARLELGRVSAHPKMVLAGEPLPDRLQQLGVEPDVLFEVSGTPASGSRPCLPRPFRDRGDRARRRAEDRRSPPPGS